jgi:anti-sigma factor RsiW
VKQTVDESLIVRYLLGQLSEDEQIQFEEHVFADPERVKNVEAIERDLIDEYARGELSESARQQFEERFLASASRRNRIAFARIFSQAINENIPQTRRASGAAAKSVSPWKNFLAFWRAPTLPKYALAALALLLVVGGVWLITKALRQRPSVPLQQAQTQAPTSGAQTSPSQVAQSAATPNPESNAQTVPSPSVAEKPRSQTSIAAIALSPGITRDSQNLPQLIIPGDAISAQLRIGIEKGETYKNFRVDLQTTSGKAIRTQDYLHAQSTRAGAVIVWQVPTAVLHTGEYELTLTGMNDQGQAEPIGYYYFKVLRK